MEFPACTERLASFVKDHSCLISREQIRQDRDVIAQEMSLMEKSDGWRSVLRDMVREIDDYLGDPFYDGKDPIEGGESCL